MDGVRRILDGVCRNLACLDRKEIGRQAGSGAGRQVGRQAGR